MKQSPHPGHDDMWWLLSQTIPGALISVKERFQKIIDLAYYLIQFVHLDNYPVEIGIEVDTCDKSTVWQCYFSDTFSPFSSTTTNELSTINELSSGLLWKS